MKNLTSYLLMLPAILVGALAMISFGVASSVWIQQILIWFIGTVISAVYLISYKNKKSREGNLVYILILLVLLILPFLFNDLDGVHRWLNLGPINLYIASIILPLLIILLWQIASNKREPYIIVTLLILLFQPDAGQLTAFAGVSVLLVWRSINNRLVIVLTTLVIALLVGFSWYFLDDLAPVPFVEQIIFLVADMGNVWLIIGILSLIMLLLPFFLYGRENIISLSLGIYFSLTMMVTFPGHFPMPVMGFGISPIIGYFIALTWLNISKYKKNC